MLIFFCFVWHESFKLYEKDKYSDFLDYKKSASFSNLLLHCEANDILANIQSSGFRLNTTKKF